MTAATPWSVKGIDPRAREAAREAARRHGLTIGEWLNQAILANEAALAAARSEPADAPAPKSEEPPAPDPALAAALAQLAERIDRNDQRAAHQIGNVDRSLAAIGKRLEAAETAMRGQSADGQPGGGAAVEAMISELRQAQGALLVQMRRVEEEEIAALRAENADRQAQLGGVAESVSALAARAARTEADTGAALQSLETALSALDEKIDRADGAKESRIEARFAAIAEDVSAQVDNARAEFAGEVAAAIEGLDAEELREALADVSKRLTSTERRHAQTIEAVSIEIKRLNESMERRLRAIETRNDDGAAAREEVAEVARAMERRLAQSDDREAAFLAQVGDDISRIAERLEHRVEVSEERSAQAIEQVSEHVGLIASRLHERQERLASEIADHLVQSEERQGARLADALSNLSATLNEVESRAHAIASPLHGAMSVMSDRLQAIESRVSSAATPPPASAPLLTPEEEATLADHHRALTEMAQELARPTLDEEDLAADAIFVEDIEARFRSRDESAFEEAPPAPEAPPAADDPFADFLADAAPEDDEDLFWATADGVDRRAGTPTSEITATDEFNFLSDLGDDPVTQTDAHADEPLGETIFEASEPFAGESRAYESQANASSAASGDYLAAARRAAQASPVLAAPEESRGGPRLRGATKALAWTAAIAATLAGGGYYYYQLQGAPSAARPAPTASAPTHAVAAAASAADPLRDPPPGSIAEAAAVGEAAPVGEDAAPRAPKPVAPHAETPKRAGPLHPSAATAPASAPVNLEQAAISGDPVAQFDLALTRYAAGDRAEGARLLRLSAEQGLAVAQYRLGKVYERGDGVRASAAEAKKWTERAALAGNVKAMHDLGVYLARGEGAALDESGAFRWFQAAAQHGVVDSQFNLGVLYLQGRGADADPQEALYWFSVAAAGGDADARARAVMLERQLGAEVVAISKARARGFHAKPELARANGALGERPWSRTPALQAAAAAPPKT